jgi:cellulose biosynthesis protein BcsQ
MLGKDALRSGVVLRDSTGRLGFVSRSVAASDDERETLAKTLTDALGAYARPDRVIVFADDPGAARLLQDPSALPVTVDQLSCRLLDRRIVGSGWLDFPAETVTNPPRIVFASLKGGVGRSTALSIAAADMARRNRNVLVIDLDLEAPGLGDLLLHPERTPRFGVIDFLVENGIGGISDAALEDFVGASMLTSAEGGRVDVIPALGTRSVANPENVLAKLARAMIEDIPLSGGAISVGRQISTMVERFSRRGGYDVVLLDSRAGLSELAAPAILDLGATILLFGTAQRQTIGGYRALFASLRSIAQRDRDAGRAADWRLALKPVYAKATMSEDRAAAHRDDLYDLFSMIYDEETPDDAGSAITFDIDDESAPHWPLVIPFGQIFSDFDPLRVPDHLTAKFYEQTFRPFLDGLDELISTADQA